MIKLLMFAWQSLIVSYPPSIFQTDVAEQPTPAWMVVSCNTLTGLKHCLKATGSLPEFAVSMRNFTCEERFEDNRTLHKNNIKTGQIKEGSES